MGAVPQNKDLYARLERLERAVNNMQRQSTLSSASISEGNLTVRRGGNIRVIDGGSITGEGDGILDWEGDAHFGGNLTIDGNTTLGGNLQFGDNVSPPEAWARRTEPLTFGSSGGGLAVSRNQTVNVTMPSWAETASVIAIGTTNVAATIAQFQARVLIDGDEGEYTRGFIDGLAATIPSVHRRDFTPSGNFSVVLQGTQQGVDPDPAEWQQDLVVMAVFTN